MEYCTSTRRRKALLANVRAMTCRKVIEFWRYQVARYIVAVRIDASSTVRTEFIETVQFLVVNAKGAFVIALDYQTDAHRQSYRDPHPKNSGVIGRGNGKHPEMSEGYA